MKKVKTYAFVEASNIIYGARSYFVKMKIVDDIKKALFEAVKEIVPDVRLDEIKLEHPAAEEHGDYSTNIALKLKIPAEKVVEKLPENKEWTVRVKGKFINFSLAPEWLTKSVTEVGEDFGKVDVGNGVKFSLEHTSPNTNKPLHIGHARNPILGMALVNILKTANYNVVSTDINNDRGAPIMKSIWAYEKFGKNSTPETMTRGQWDEIASQAKIPNMIPYMVDGKVKSDHFVGLFYVVGNAFYEEDEAIKKEITDLVFEWEKKDPRVRKIWKQMNGWFYQGDKMTLDRLGAYFDKEWYESDVYDKGKVIVEDGVKRGVFKKFDDGHVEAILEPFGLPNVVLLRSNGTALYITQDIELVRRRIVEDGNFYNYIQTSNEQNLRFKQLYKICEMLGYGKAEQFIHLGYGMVNTPEGKMSSRLGNVVLLDDLLDTMTQLATRLMDERKIGVEYAKDEKNKIAEAVGIGALKYAILKVNPLMDITFDLEKSVSLDGDSGPYLQYTYARARSVLRKSETKRLSRRPLQEVLLQDEERAILRYLYRFPEVVEQAAKNYAPNLVCGYLFELAKRFNNLYNNCPILGNDLRLQLTETTATVIKNGLNLLGIEVLEKM